MRTSETYFKVYCSKEQKKELEQRAKDEGLSLPNFVRQRLEIPLEQQGNRKDLLAGKDTANNSMDVRQKQRR
jgi:hypothetical protein